MRGDCNWGFLFFYYVIMYHFRYQDLRHSWESVAGGGQSTFVCFAGQKVCSSFYTDTQTPAIVRLLKGQQQGVNLASLHFTETPNESVSWMHFHRQDCAKLNVTGISSNISRDRTIFFFFNRLTCMRGFFFLLQGALFQNEYTSSKVRCKPALNLDLLLV